MQRRSLLLLMALLLIAACASLNGKKEKTLDATLYTYETAMRWGLWDTLIGYRAENAPQMPNLSLEQIRVTAYELRQPPVPIADDIVWQVVEIQYVRADEQRLRKLFDKQDWRYDTERNQWRLYSPFPELR